MKSILSLFLFLALVTACQSKETKAKTIAPERFNEKSPYSDNLDNWVSYYRKTNPGFKLSDFVKTDSGKLTIDIGNVHASYDKEFDSLYLGFFVYFNGMDKYIDFDSYSTYISEDFEISFEVDQAINVVDCKRKTVQQVGFRGSTQWVEDAFWVNANEIVLLENTEEGKPVITKIDLEKKTTTTYRYPKKIKGKQEYSTVRLKRILHLVE